MQEEVQIRAARSTDLEDIKTLLLANDLPTAGVDEHWKTFVVAWDGSRLVACGGSETYPAAALIRSVTVAPDYRRTGVGRRVVRELLDRLSSHGLREFYLLTTTAEEYFRKRGFTTIDRDEVNPALLASREFQDACPDTAVCMRLVMLS